MNTEQVALSVRSILMGHIEASLRAELDNKKTRKGAKKALCALADGKIGRDWMGTVWCQSATQKDLWYRVSEKGCACAALLPCWHGLSFRLLLAYEQILSGLEQPRHKMLPYSLSPRLKR